MNVTSRHAVAAALAALALVAGAATDLSALMVGGILPIFLGLMLLADAWHREAAELEAAAAREDAAWAPSKPLRRHGTAHTRRKPANAPTFRLQSAGGNYVKLARR